MKKEFLKKITVFAAVLLILASFTAVFSSCSVKAVKDPIFVCGESKMPLYFYEYMLSVKKGELASAKYDVKSEKFWATKAENGKTYEENFNSDVLEVCKKYFAAAVIFDRMGLKLSVATVAEIDESIEFLLDYDADGDVEKFNSIICDFGVDKDQLRDCYVILAKKDAVISALYGADGSLIADSLKNQYYKDNYYRFKQILFRNYYYEYEVDKVYGTEIYFDPENGKPLYDKKNGQVAFDDDDNYVRDSYGEVIYFGADGKPLYDTENGEKSAKLEDGEAVQHKYSKEELDLRLEGARELAESIEKKNFSFFESELEKMIEAEDLGNSYPEGYYVSDLERDSYKNFDYMGEILDLLKSMEVGEVRLHISDFGYHVIMKYELDDGRFSDGEYAEWFNSFTSSIVSEMFNGEIDKVLPEISSDQDNLAKARSIKDIGINYNY